MNDLELNLTLSVNDVNIVLSALGKLPFEQVSQLIIKLREQAVSQLPTEQKSE